MTLLSKKFVSLFFLSCAFFFAECFTFAAQFIALSDIQGGIYSSNAVETIATGISGDGSTLVGYLRDSSQDRPFNWILDDESFNYLPALPTSRPLRKRYALGTSGDGTVIVGADDFRAFRWEDGTGIAGLGTVPFTRSSSHAWAVSENGDTIAGWGYDKDRKAFVWHETTGMLSLGSLGSSPTRNDFSAAFGVSGDGSIVVGESTTPDGIEAFRWAENTGMVGLGDLPGGKHQSMADAISADGKTIVGFGSSEDYYMEAVRWNELLEIEALGALSNHAGSEAYAVSRDGSVIVGTSFHELPEIRNQTAFVWTKDRGMQSLSEVLIDAGIDMTGWTLSEAKGVSYDGTRIVGTGFNPQGNREVWVAILSIPEPSMFVLSFLAAMLSCCRRATR